ncbi:MAG: hypothetical protein ACRDKY_09810, partial [Solirubrobacteraceae bacterium]
ERADALERLAGASQEEVAAIARTAVPPSAEAIAAQVVAVRSASRRVTVSALTRPLDGWGLGGGIVSTAAPAAAAVRLIARGRIEARGVRPPEACIDPDDLFGELERRGCSFTVAHEAAPAERSAA